MVRIEVSQLAGAAERAALCRMLRACDDFPQDLVRFYERPLGMNRDVTLVAWRDSEPVGMLNGTFDADLNESGAFASFTPPQGAHAYLDRVHVPSALRGLGIGLTLVRFYASEAIERGCTFIGGSLDLSSDPTGRRRFFERLGFQVREHDNFGATPEQVL